MKKFSRFICNHALSVCIISLILLVLSAVGMALTKINYDILVYLPTDNETIIGQNILNKDFNMGAYSIVIVDNQSSKTILSLEQKIKEVEGVDKVVSIYDVLGNSVPIEMLPSNVIDKLHKENTDIMFITFDDSTSSNRTLEAVKNIRKITGATCRLGGMSSMVLDTMELSDKEIAVYIVIAVVLCLIVLEVSLDSYLVPVLLLLNIGASILFNLGTNIFLGEISYITKALVAVLQLGVTTDFSIFLYHSYEDKKKKYKDRKEAMSEAVIDTFASVTGSSLTTVAGFLVLCAMQLTLGKDLGIVMAKGVILGVISVLTLFPSLLLLFDKVVEKTTHRVVVPKFNNINKVIVKYNKVFLILFLVLIIPFYKANSKVDVYYKVDTSLPKYLDSIRANNELKDLYKIVSPEIILVDKNMKNNEVNNLVDDLEKIDGISFALSFSKIKELGITEGMISEDIVSMISNEKYQAILINSLYEVATDELNEQIVLVDDVVKSYDKNAIVAGEGPLMKDLIKISDKDFSNVNIWSIAVIFVILFIVLKSFSLPFLLISAIEFAIFFNMGISYFDGSILPFVAPIVLGTIQLGATIDYAILMTTTYRKNRKLGLEKHKAMEETLNYCGISILVSGMCFFAATFGVGLYSKLEMVGSLCTLISRGALISMLVVITVLPSILITFDYIINKTEISLGGKKMKNKKIAALMIGACLLACPFTVKADSKSETVYTKLNSDGSRKNTIVTEHIENTSGRKTIVDYTTLKNIDNLANNNKFSVVGKKVTWEANQEDVFYQGETDQELPIEMNIKYYLDGILTDVQDMLGKSGKVKIVIEYKNNDEHRVNINGTSTKMYTPFIVGTGTILENDINKSIKATNAKVISNGNKSVIVGLSIPGLSESLNDSSIDDLDSVTISYKTTNFKSPSIYATATTALYSEFDTSIFDRLDTVFDSLDSLQENMDKIESGAKELQSGVKSSVYKIKNNKDDALDSNTLEGIVNQTVNSIKVKENDIKAAAWDKVEYSLDHSTDTTVANYVKDSVTKILATYLDGQTNLYYYSVCGDTNADVTTKMSACQALATSRGVSPSDQTAITAMMNEIYSFQTTITNIISVNTKESVYYTAKNVSKEIASSVSLQTAESVARTLSPTVANSVKQGTLDTIATSLETQLVPGIDKLTEGITKYNNDGIKQLSKKGKTIKNSINKVKKLIEIGQDYDSFTCDSTIKSETKFIFVVDGEEKVEEEVVKKAEDNNQNLWDRIINLF